MAVNSKYIDGHQLQQFLDNQGPIHYEEYFPYFNKKPVRMVAWAISETRGWAERIEHRI
jgi:hypothetical protein